MEKLNTKATFVAFICAFIWADSVSAQTNFYEYDGDYPASFEQAYALYYKERFEPAYIKFREMAELGDPIGQWFVGIMYFNGEAVRQDYAEARKWYLLSANNGFVLAMSNLGYIYENGHGVPKNDELALVWYKRAVEAGHKSSEQRVAEIEARLAAKTRQAEQLAADAKRQRKESYSQQRRSAESVSSGTTAMPTDIVRSPSSESQWSDQDANDFEPSRTYSGEIKGVNLVGETSSRSTGWDRITFKGLEGAVVGVSLAIFATFIYLVIWIFKRANKYAGSRISKFRSAAEPNVRAVKTKSKAVLSRIGSTEEDRILNIDDEFFEVASRELSHGEQKEGLWLKSLALAEGDANRQKAIYIRLRAQQLSDS